VNFTFKGDVLEEVVYGLLVVLLQKQ
jgi:hypothetical protein